MELQAGGKRRVRRNPVKKDGGEMQATIDIKETQFRMYKKYFMRKYYQVKTIIDIKQLIYEIDKIVAQEGLEDGASSTYNFGDIGRKVLGMGEKLSNFGTHFGLKDKVTNQYAARDAGSMLMVSSSRLLMTLMTLKTLLKIKAHEQFNEDIESESIDINGKTLDDIMRLAPSIRVGNVLEARAYGIDERQKQSASTPWFARNNQQYDAAGLPTSVSLNPPEIGRIAIGGRQRKLRAKPKA